MAVQHVKLNVIGAIGLKPSTSPVGLGPGRFCTFTVGEYQLLVGRTKRGTDAPTAPNWKEEVVLSELPPGTTSVTLSVVRGSYRKGDKVLGQGELRLPLGNVVKPQAVQHVKLYHPETNNEAGEVALSILECCVRRLTDDGVWVPPAGYSGAAAGTGVQNGHTSDRVQDRPSNGRTIPGSSLQSSLDNDAGQCLGASPKRSGMSMFKLFGRKQTKKDSGDTSYSPSGSELRRGAGPLSGLSQQATGDIGCSPSQSELSGSSEASTPAYLTRGSTPAHSGSIASPLAANMQGSLVAGVLSSQLQSGSISSSTAPNLQGSPASGVLLSLEPSSELWSGALAAHKASSGEDTRTPSGSPRLGQAILNSSRLPSTRPWSGATNGSHAPSPSSPRAGDGVCASGSSSGTLETGSSSLDTEATDRVTTGESAGAMSATKESSVGIQGADVGDTRDAEALHCPADPVAEEGPGAIGACVNQGVGTGAVQQVGQETQGGFAEERFPFVHVAEEVGVVYLGTAASDADASLSPFAPALAASTSKVALGGLEGKDIPGSPALSSSDSEGFVMVPSSNTCDGEAALPAAELYSGRTAAQGDTTGAAASSGPLTEIVPGHLAGDVVGSSAFVDPHGPLFDFLVPSPFAKLAVREVMFPDCLSPTDSMLTSAVTAQCLASPSPSQQAGPAVPAAHPAGNAMLGEGQSLFPSGPISIAGSSPQEGKAATAAAPLTRETEAEAASPEAGPTFADPPAVNTLAAPSSKLPLDVKSRLPAGERPAADASPAEEFAVVVLADGANRVEANWPVGVAHASVDEGTERGVPRSLGLPRRTRVYRDPFDIGGAGPAPEDSPEVIAQAYSRIQDITSRFTRRSTAAQIPVVAAELIVSLLSNNSISEVQNAAGSTNAVLSNNSISNFHSAAGLTDALLSNQSVGESQAAAGLTDAVLSNASVSEFHTAVGGEPEIHTFELFVTAPAPSPPQPAAEQPAEGVLVPRPTAAPLPSNAANVFEDEDDWRIDPSSIEFVLDDKGRKCELGRGGFGVVYRGKLYGMLEVAIKQLNLTQLRPVELAKAKRDFENEIRTLKRMRCPQIVQFMGACMQTAADGDDPPEWLLVTELMEGDLYGALSARNSEYTWYKKGAKVALEIAKGLGYLHCMQRTVHYDIKSPNILLNKDGIAKIADVGLAKMIKDNPTLSSHTIGTVSWCAPEVLVPDPKNYPPIEGEFALKIKQAVDIWSFGVVLWEICTGEQPHSRYCRRIEPHEAPEDIKKLSEQCRSAIREERPAAIDIVQTIEKHVKAMEDAEKKQKAHAAAAAQARARARAKKTDV